MRLQCTIDHFISHANELMRKMMENRRINLSAPSTSLNPSSLIQNPSFLHGNDLIGDKYITLDSLALRRTSLPLQLSPNYIDMTDNVSEKISNEINDLSINLPTKQLDSQILQSVNCSNEDGANDIPQLPPKPVDNIANKEGIDLGSQLHKESRVSWEETTAKTIVHKVSGQQNKFIKKRYSSSAANVKCVVKSKSKWSFSSKVLHYVPKRGKRPKKFLKKLTNNINKNDNKTIDDWPRRSVSLPTDFVHVAGVTRWSWLKDSDSCTYNDSSRIITHKQKCATLMLINDKQINHEDDYYASSSLETLVNEDIDDLIKQQSIKITESLNDKTIIDSSSQSALLSKPRANHSFLWSNISKASNDIKILTDKFNDNEVYDDVGPPPQINISESLDETYDDVGLSGTNINELISSVDHNEEDDQVYDDVIPLVHDQNIVKELNGENNEDQIELRKKIQVLPIVLGNAQCNEHPSTNIEDDKDVIYMGNNYSSVGGDTDNEDSLYDDVIVLAESRVNSIYAGSINISQLDQSKESEWEDVEEYLSCNDLPKSNTLKSMTELQCIPSKRKSGQRWTRKVRRQRSKASRKNSMRSSKLMTRQSSNFSDTESDDSNYETLCSFEPTGESINSMMTGDGEYQNQNTIVHGLKTQIIIPEPPSRPIPPIPRESTLTETFGKRMKMLKRTWSITKGSLGRMRRRTSVLTTDTESNVDDTCQKLPLNNDNNSNDGRKTSQVFNFKKHFQKSISSLSTFYLDNENHFITSRNNNTSIDDIYGNSNWYASSNYTSRQDSSSTDDYNMLSEEPLYQFYAAATVRGAFQSDSDNYEETENSKTLPSTSELTKPGHRTLWCQTPQIINSDLLERLTADEKKIQEAKFEILTSEASYLNSLRVLVNEYVINHELVYDALTSSEREKLFGNVPSVLIASERLLAELESAWRIDPMLKGIPDILLQHAERCSKIYIEYCSNQVSIDLTLRDLRSKKSSKFIETVARIESHPASQSLSLHSFLMLPMQRVTRLPLLADAVLSKLSTEHEERLQWEKVLSILSKVVMECNEAARMAGRQIEMENLSKKIEYSPKVPSIDLHDRYLVRSGPVTQIMAKPGTEYVLTFRKKYSKTPLYLLLLTDHLLVAKLKSNGAQDDFYLIIDSCKRSLVVLERVPDDSPFAGRHSMILTLLENYCGRRIEYILSCDNATDRERWLDAASPPKADTVGETLYETWDCPQVMALYSYTPCQPDELSLQPGDVINVLRKLPDGWNVGEKLVGGEQGWFPDNFTKEVASEHVRARNLRQRHRLLALSESLVQQRAKQTANMNR
ncbi:hypothetical protein PV328_008062 [Microctonus aethiopoides]|uniref:Ephexin-1 n=1 Tax=Microctonus aethiopoides TaxID=144406 RepID=A0AA39CAJ9_9HYME|nr:hypothetical protein PV328_008062 [Microctonus aethiopoides]